jgi:DNA-binding LacI/PurR family transcriptional regulator/biotin operon repressor
VTAVREPVLKSVKRPVLRPRGRALQYLRQHLGDTWTVGDQLPPELDIAEHLGIARGTVRAAMKELENEGLLAAGRGNGRVVRATPDGPAVEPPASLAAGRVLRETVVFARVPHTPVANNGLIVERAIFNAFAARGNPVLAVDLNNADAQALDRLIAGRPLGLVAPHAVAFSEGCREKLHAIEAAGIPVVVQGDGDELEAFSRVISDHRQGIRLLVEHLRERGIERPVQVRSIGFGPLPYWAKPRYDGFDEDAADLDARIVRDRPDTFTGGESADDEATFDFRVRLMAGLLVEQLTGPKPADALLFDTDYLCFYAATALRRFGLEPNEDVLLVGYDDYWTTSPLRRFERASVDVTINKDEETAGETLAALLLDRLQTSGDPPPTATDGRLHVRPPKLVVTPTTF